MQFEYLVTIDMVSLELYDLCGMLTCKTFGQYAMHTSANTASIVRSSFCQCCCKERLRDTYSHTPDITSL